MKKNSVLLPFLLIVYLFININGFSSEKVEPMFKKETKDGIVLVAQPYTGYLVSYYENGKVKAKENYTEGILIGKIEYYENGEILNAETYEQNRERAEKKSVQNLTLNKKKEDPEEYKEYVSYYENGQMKEEAVYVSGKIDGDYKSYYEDGTLKEEGRYNMGSLEGDYKAYYENKQLRVQKHYVRGELHGDYIWYYDTGQVKETIQYNMGKPHGENIVYYKNGQKEKIENYNKGELLQETVYHLDGKVMFEETYVDAENLKELKDSLEEFMTIDRANGEVVENKK